jgi:hypothetical protein
LGSSERREKDGGAGADPDRSTIARSEVRLERRSRHGAFTMMTETSTKVKRPAAERPQSAAM